jgi:uncharacterized damage-inducible protein DinB
MWPVYHRRLRDVVASLDDGQLDLPVGYRQWPLWALVGHTACQRVFWLCDFAGEPGADTTRFTDAGHDCPGDDDLENRLTADELAEALDATFRIVANCLDGWSLEMLDETLRRPEWGDDWAHTRGSVLQRVFSHDVYHCAELNLVLPEDRQIVLWD